MNDNNKEALRSKANAKWMADYATTQAHESADHAEDVLEIFCASVDIAEVPDKKIMAYLAECFRHILDGTDAREALNLNKRGPGQRRGRTLEDKDQRDIDLARKVVRHMTGGMYRDDAIEEVAQTTGASDSRTRKAYEEYSGLVRRTELD